MKRGTQKPFDMAEGFPSFTVKNGLCMHRCEAAHCKLNAPGRLWELWISH